MFVDRSPRVAASIALAALLGAAPTFAQTAPAEPPAPVATPAPAAPATSAAPPVWDAPPPPPLPPGARVPRPVPRYDEEPAGDTGRRDFVSGRRECPDPQRAGRIVAESVAGAAVAVASFFIGKFAQDASSSGQVILGTLGAITMYLTVTPAAVSLVGSTFGGHGRYWASLLGGVLIPVAGHVGGYELSHDPVCDDAPTGPRALLRYRDRRLPAATAVRVVPMAAPNLTGAGGATAGVAITF